MGRTCLLLVATLVVPACGGDTALSVSDGGDRTTPVSKTSAPTEQEARTLCGRICLKEEKCQGIGAPDECVDDCLRGYRIFRSDALHTFTSCYEGSDCFVDEDQCLEKIQPLDVHRALEMKCSAKQDQCPDAFLGLACESDLMKLFTPQFIGELSSCMDKSCRTVDRCLEEVLTKSGLDF